MRKSNALVMVRESAASQRDGLCSALALIASQQGAIFGFKAVKAGLEELVAGNHHHVEPAGRLVLPKEFSDPALCPVATDSAAQAPGRHDSKPNDPQAVGENDEGHEPAVKPDSLAKDPLKFRAAPDPLVRPECGRTDYDDTDSRLRPLARRRFSTSRPFLVLMRTRNPWVFRRRRRFG